MAGGAGTNSLFPPSHLTKAVAEFNLISYLSWQGQSGFRLVRLLLATVVVVSRGKRKYYVGKRIVFQFLFTVYSICGTKVHACRQVKHLSKYNIKSLCRIRLIFFPPVPLPDFPDVLKNLE